MGTMFNFSVGVCVFLGALEHCSSCFWLYRNGDRRELLEHVDKFVCPMDFTRCMYVQFRHFSPDQFSLIDHDYRHVSIRGCECALKFCRRRSFCPSHSGCRPRHPLGLRELTDHCHLDRRNSVRFPARDRGGGRQQQHRYQGVRVCQPVHLVRAQRVGLVRLYRHPIQRCRHLCRLHAQSGRFVHPFGEPIRPHPGNECALHRGPRNGLRVLHYLKLGVGHGIDHRKHGAHHGSRAGRIRQPDNCGRDRQPFLELHRHDHVLGHPRRTPHFVDHDSGRIVLGELLLWRHQFRDANHHRLGVAHE